MTTTIKVSEQTRDLLKEQAHEHGRTLGQHLDVLANNAERERRFSALKSAIDSTSPASMKSYKMERDEFDAMPSPKLPDDDWSA